MPFSDYIELRFRSTRDSELVQASLTAFEPLGFLEEEDSWSCYFTAAAWDRDGDEVRHMLGRLHPRSSFACLGMEKRNWNEEWEKSIRPIDVSERFIIAPSWHPVTDSRGKTVLVIDPKMSFGTGYHATTRLMLRLLETALRRGDRVLDVGTGTGVLAIAAVLLGAEYALGVDIDEWSRDNAVENAQRNGVGDRTEFLHGDIETASGSWDLLLSNITKRDNLELLPRMIGMLRPAGRVILSGFTIDDMPEIRQACSAHGARMTASLVEDEWAACTALPSPV